MVFTGLKLLPEDTKILRTQDPGFFLPFIKALALRLKGIAVGLAAIFFNGLALKLLPISIRLKVLLRAQRSCILVREPKLEA